MDELKPVKLEFSGKLAQGVVIRFESDTFHKVYSMARKQGVTMDALIHQWVVERLEEITLPAEIE